MVVYREFVWCLFEKVRENASRVIMHFAYHGNASGWMPAMDKLNLIAGFK